MATSCTSDPVSAAGCAGLPAFLVPASFCAGLLAADFLLVGLRSAFGFSAASVSAVFLPLTLRCTFGLSVDSALVMLHCCCDHVEATHRVSVNQVAVLTDVGHWVTRASRQCAPGFCRLPRISPLAGAFDLRLIGSLVSSMLFWSRDLVATMMAVERFLTAFYRSRDVRLLTI